MKNQKVYTNQMTMTKFPDGDDTTGGGSGGGTGGSGTGGSGSGGDGGS